MYLVFAMRSSPEKEFEMEDSSEMKKEKSEGDLPLNGKESDL